LLVGLLFIPIINTNFSFVPKNVCSLVIAWVHKGYKCHHLPFNMVYTSRGVIFNENVFPLSILPFLDSPSNSTNLHVAIDQFEDYVHAPSALHNHGTCTGAWLELLKELQLLSISSPKLPTLSKSRDHVNHGCVPPMKLHGPSLPLGHERWIIMHMCMLVGPCMPSRMCMPTCMCMRHNLPCLIRRHVKLTWFSRFVSDRLACFIDMFDSLFVSCDKCCCS
jgi:hypothetical protein